MKVNQSKEYIKRSNIDIFLIVCFEDQIDIRLSHEIKTVPCLVNIQRFGGKNSDLFKAWSWVIIYGGCALPRLHTPPPESLPYQQDPTEYRALHLRMVWLQDLPERCHCW